MAVMLVRTVVVSLMFPLDSDGEYSIGTTLDLYAPFEVFDILAEDKMITKQSGQNAERRRDV